MPPHIFWNQVALAFIQACIINVVIRSLEVLCEHDGARYNFYRH